MDGNISTNRFQLTSKGEFLLVGGVDGNISTNRFQLTSKGEFLLVGGGWEYVQIGSSLQAEVSSCWWGGGWEYQYK